MKGRILNVPVNIFVSKYGKVSLYEEFSDGINAHTFAPYV
jgi:hypothetical protein